MFIYLNYCNGVFHIGLLNILSKNYKTLGTLFALVRITVVQIINLLNIDLFVFIKMKLFFYEPPKIPY